MKDNNFIPYVTILTSKGEMKFLVDTGANKNYISPDHVNIENCTKENGIKVTNINGTHDIEKSVTFDLFGIKKKLKFYVFKFHEFFDGLIGYESLREMKAQLNIGNNTLKIGRKELKLKKKFPQQHKIFLSEQEFQFIKIPVKPNRDFLVEEEIQLPHFTILPGLYSSIGNVATVAIKKNEKQEATEVHLNEIEIGTEYYELTKIPQESKAQYFLRDEHMNDEEKRALTEVIENNRTVLYTETDSLSFTHKIKHQIRTSDNIPVHTKSYKYPYIYETEVQNQVKKMLEDGIIKESISPYTSPVWVVPKKSDASGKRKFRLVIDYRKLNEKTISDKYPIPEISDILDRLGRTTYFSTIDLVSGFHQIQLADEDTEKTAFSINSGKYEFTRMPFGLKNAPATFQRVMDCVLRDLVGVCCFVYMDDIIVFSSSLQEHKNHLNMVLKRLKDANLKIQLDKCEFFKKEVQFLGHTVSEDGVRPNNDKIEIVKTWPIPKNEKEVRQFLGTIGYYRRFIKDFAKIVKPLTVLLRKDSEFLITPEIVTCFEKCKQILTMDPVLIYPDFTKDFVLTTDASDYAIGAVLSQGPVGKDRPIAYASRTLNKTEEKYSTTEKELLAMVWAVKHFRPYLYGRRFKLITDHQPLTYSLSNSNGRIIRGKLALEEFDYELVYKPGRQNTIADALSRIKPDELNTNSQSSIINEPPDSEDDSMTVHSADSSDDYYIWCTEKPINMFRTQIIFKISTNSSTHYEQVFQKYHRHIVEKPSYTEEIIVEILKDLLNPKGVNCLKIPLPLTQLVQETYKKHFHRNNIFKVFISEVLLEDVKEPQEQDDLVKTTHEYAHRGIKENKAQILRKYFFPEIEKKLKIFINSCDTCRKSKYDRNPYKLIQKSNFGNAPFERIHIDIFFLKGNKWLTVVDSFSKFANVIPIETRTIVDVKKAISEHIRIFGRPKVIVSDQEPSFISIDFVGFLNEIGTEIHHASNSNSNGIVERFHSTIIELYRTMKTKYREYTLIDQMNILTDIYNNTIHSVTNQKPRDLIFNIRDNTNTAEIIEHYNKLQSAVKVALHKKKQQFEAKMSTNEQPKQLNPNDQHYIKISQRQTKDKNPYKISTVKTNNELTYEDTHNIKIHKNRIKR